MFSLQTFSNLLFQFSPFFVTVLSVITSLRSGITHSLPPSLPLLSVRRTEMLFVPLASLCSVETIDWIWWGGGGAGWIICGKDKDRQRTDWAKKQHIGVLCQMFLRSQKWFHWLSLKSLHWSLRPYIHFFHHPGRGGSTLSNLCVYVSIKSRNNLTNISVDHLF